MGQYYTPANLTKAEYLDPEYLGDGPNLYSMALQLQPGGVASALVMLLAHRDGLPSASVAEAGEVVGRWAGDEVILLGDEQGSEDVEERLSAMPEPMKDITQLARQEIERQARGWISYSVEDVRDDQEGSRSYGEVLFSNTVRRINERTP